MNKTPAETEGLQGVVAEIIPGSPLIRGSRAAFDPKPIVLGNELRQTLGQRLLQSARPDGDCLVWARTVNKDGYGYISFGGQKYSVSRLAYAVWHGDPGTAHVLHRCDNPPCILPEHLSLGTHRDNMADRNAKGRQAKGESNGRNKLTSEAVRLIRELAATGYAYSRLASAFGVDPTTVRDIVRGRIWSEVAS